jgi:N-acetylneuraminate lyase
MKSSNLDRFKGVIVALYSAFDKNDAVDDAAVKKMCRFYADAGVTGLYVCGSSGEGLLMTVAERQQTLAAVMDEVGKELTIIVHVGALATRDSIALAKHAASLGAHALSAIPPAYYRLPESSIAAHWNKIIDSTPLPFIIYNIPQLTGYDLSLSLLKKLAANDKVIGVKNTSMSTYQVQQFKQAGGADFIVFNGPDEQYLAGRSMGAEAGIGGTYGVMPELFLKIEECFQAGDIQAAQAWQTKVNEIITKLLAYPSLFGATKSILKLRGVDTGQPRPPFEPVTVDKYPDLRKLHKTLMGYVRETKIKA